MQQTVNQISHDDEVYADWTDVASVETDKTLQLKIRDRERMLMTKIYEALRRIEDGTFGECERCGDEIAEPRFKCTPRDNPLHRLQIRARRRGTPLSVRMIEHRL